MKLRSGHLPAFAGITPDASFWLRLWVVLLDILSRLFPGLPIAIP